MFNVERNRHTRALKGKLEKKNLEYLKIAVVAMDPWKIYLEYSLVIIIAV